jgi:hypothetical protein
MFQVLVEFIGGLFGARRLSTRFSRAAAESRRPWRRNATFSRDVLSPEPYAIVEERIGKLLASIGTPREAAEVGALEAVTGPARKSNGTVVHVQLIDVPNGTRVAVAAWPGAQLFDWGESRRVVETVIAGLGPTTPAEVQAVRFR